MTGFSIATDRSTAKRQLRELEREFDEWSGDLENAPRWVTWWHDMLDRVAEGETIHKVCKRMEWREGTFLRWVRLREDMSRQLKEAEAIYADRKAQETIDIADLANPDDVAVRKLQVETRLKVASKLNPEKWGDQRQVGISLGKNNSLVFLLSGMNEAIDVTPTAENGQT